MIKRAYTVTMGVLVVLSAAATAGPTLYQGMAEPYTILHNWFGSGAQSAMWNQQNPYIGDYGAVLADGGVQQATLTIAIDDLDLGGLAQLFIQDGQGAWHGQDVYGQAMYLNTMAFEDCIFVHIGPGSPYEGHITKSSFYLDPGWLGGENMLKLVWEGWDQIEIETSTLALVVNQEEGQAIIHSPAPGAILLGSMGVALVGYLRRRRAI